MSILVQLGLKAARPSYKLNESNKNCLNYNLEKLVILYLFVVKFSFRLFNLYRANYLRRSPKTIYDFHKCPTSVSNIHIFKF